MSLKSARRNTSPRVRAMRFMRRSSRFSGFFVGLRMLSIYDIDMTKPGDAWRHAQSIKKIEHLAANRFVALQIHPVDILRDLAGCFAKPAGDVLHGRKASDQFDGRALAGFGELFDGRQILAAWLGLPSHAPNIIRPSIPYKPNEAVDINDGARHEGVQTSRRPP